MKRMEALPFVTATIMTAIALVLTGCPATPPSEKPEPTRDAAAPEDESPPDESPPDAGTADESPATGDATGTDGDASTAGDDRASTEPADTAEPEAEDGSGDGQGGDSAVPVADGGPQFPRPEGVDPEWQPHGYTPEQPEPWDLGPPLVENAESLKRLDPDAAIWVDREGERLVLMGRVVLRNAPLELFACLRNSKEHESVVAIDVPSDKAYVIHAGLLATGAEPGRTVQWDPVYQPASGQEIDVEVRYKDPDGATQSLPAQQWITNLETGETMDQKWVFAGSGFWVDERTGEKHYRAAGGDIICVSNFATAILDLPVESSQSNHALMFKANEPAIPPLGTPVTLVLTPKKAD